MSIAHPPQSAPSRQAELPRDEAGRDRLLALVTQLDGDRLAAAEELLSGMVAHQLDDTRGLTDAEVSALARFGVSEAELREPASMGASARGLVWEREAEGQSATVAEVAELLGVTTARIRQRCAAGTLIAQRRSDGWYLPRFQFLDGREPRGWAVVAQAIPRAIPLLVAERVLTSPAPRLFTDGEELAPLEWLAQGGDPGEAAAAVDDALHRLS